ncbi:MAG: BatD family protein [Chloroflexota bacterium]
MTQRVGAQECVPPVDTIRLNASVDLTAPYVGEQIIYTIQIENTLENPPSFDPPPFEGMWRAGRLEITTSVADVCGVKVSVTTSQYILFPLRPGEIVIPPGTLDFSLNPVFEARTRVLSNEVMVNVLPVPQLDAPDSFGGLVGYPFFIDTTVGRTSARAGDPISLRVKVEGSGNIEQMPPPQLPLPENWRIYQQQSDLATATEGESLVGSKTFEWLVVPEGTGAVEIPSIELSYYDNNTGIFRTIFSEPITLDILPSENLPEAEVAAVAPEVEAGLPALRPIASVTGRQNTAWLWWFWLLPPLVLMGSAGYRWQTSRAARQAVRRRQSGALRTAKTNLSAVTRQRGDRAYKDLIMAVLTYFGDRWNTDALALDQNEIASRLLDEDVDDEIVQQIITCMRGAEEGRYAPDDSSPPRALVKQTLMALIAVDAAGNAR